MNIIERLETMIDEINEIKALYEDEQRDPEAGNTARYPLDSYVYRHWTGEGKGRRCVYIGSGTGDRAWAPREGREEEYTVEIVVDGLDRDTAYRIESTFMEDYLKTHKGNMPKYNIDGTPEYHPAVDGMAGPWQLCYFYGNEKIAETPVFKSNIRSLMGTFRSASNNKISAYKGPWIEGLTRGDYDSVRIRRREG